MSQNDVDEVEAKVEAIRKAVGDEVDLMVDAHGPPWYNAKDAIIVGKSLEQFNLLFYEDPDYGFVLNALIKEPGESTPVHDHGEVLTVYGVLAGGETVRRYRRVDAGAGENGGPEADDGIELELIGDHEVAPGYIDFVPPGDIHVEHNGPHRTIGLILRNGNVGKNLQSWYDEDTGTRIRRYGPKQVPHELT